MVAATIITMEKYILKTVPPPVYSASQWDGSKDSMNAIISEFNITDKIRSYNEDGTVYQFKLGRNEATALNVNPGDFIVISDTDIPLQVVSADEFSKKFVKSKK